MSWTQEEQFEDLTSLLARLVGLDIQKLVQDEITKRCLEQGISVVSINNFDYEQLMEEWDYGPLARQKVTLSDGRVFAHELASSDSDGESFGSDHYQFVEQK